MQTYGLNGDYGILTKGTRNSDVYGFDVPFGEDAQVRFIMGNENGAAYLYRVGCPSVDDGLWHFVAAKAIRNSNTMKLYQDGIQTGILTTDGLQGLDMSSDASLKIGVGRLFSYYYGGNLDDIRIFNRELNDTEIMALYCENPLASIQTPDILMFSNDIFEMPVIANNLQLDQKVLSFHFDCLYDIQKLEFRGVFP